MKSRLSRVGPLRKGAGLACGHRVISNEFGNEIGISKDRK